MGQTERRVEGALDLEGTPGGVNAPEIGTGHTAGSVTDSVYLRLQAGLMSLEIAPGQRLAADTLARELNVSPTPVREALSRLEAEGLVLKTHLRGFRAAPQLTAAEFGAMFEVRLLLEPFAARRAASLVTPAQLSALRELEAEMRTASGRQDAQHSYQAFAALDAQFHTLIATIAGNPIVVDTLDRLHVHLHLFRVRRDLGIARPALSEHRQLVSALEMRDEEIAEAAMKSHLTRSLHRILAVDDASDQAPCTPAAEAAGPA